VSAMQSGSSIVLFAIAADRQPYTIRRGPGERWADWRPMARLRARPGASLAAAARGAQLSVFAVGEDRCVWTWDDGWGRLDTLMMPLLGEAGPPPDPRLTAIVAPGRDVLWLVAAGSDGNVYVARWGPG